MKDFDTYIFDLDGTLLSSLDDLAASTNYALRWGGMPERTTEEVRMFVGNGVKLLMERAIPDGQQNPRFEEVYAKFREHYLKHNLDRTRPYEGVIGMLRELKRRGKKPAPDTVLEALRQLGAPKEGAVYVGDSDVDVMTAKNSGLPCISVLWGFRDKEFLIKHGATLFVEKPQEILAKL